MQATQSRNQATAKTSVRTVKLRSDVFDALCIRRDKDAQTNGKRAELLELDRVTVYRLRRHLMVASVSMAWHIAQKLGCTVEDLFSPNANPSADSADKVAERSAA